ERSLVSEFLGEILGAPFAEESSPPLRAARRDAQLTSEQMRAAFLRFVAAECEQAPLSNGNAFYLEELIRWAAERHESELPETLVTMVQARLGALALVALRRPA